MVTRKEGVTMHFVTAKGILSAGGGMNFYRGCQHGCVYCDARSRCYQMNHIFEDIEVKENAMGLLEAALKNKRKPCMIGTGAMSDPYMPVEENLGMTRRMLELAEKYGFGATVLTKSDRVLRDLDILRRINAQTKAVVQISLTIMDDKLSRILEPNVCPTSRRIEVLRELQKAGIPAVVWLCPVLPFLTDTEENIGGILEACRDAGVKGVIQFGMGLTLREGNREYFYAALDRHFPGLKEVYIRTYGNAYELPSSREEALLRLFHESCENYGIWHDNDHIFHYLHTFEGKDNCTQLSLFD